MPYYYAVVFPFEKYFDPNNSMKWMNAYWTHSVTIALAYAIIIYVGRRIMFQRKAMTLDKPLFIWNSILAIFSIAGLTRTSPEFFHSLFSKGFQHSICDPASSQGVAEFWIYMFAMSKAFELVDTVFIVLRKRPLTFLHVYHHMSVLIYSWHGYKDDTAAGRWFVWMNYGVHSIMYTYYACRSIDIKFNKFLPMTITTLQLCQMVVGCYISIVVYLTKLKQQNCHQTYENLYFCFFIYFTYCLLFINFFYKTYIKKDGRYKKVQWYVCSYNLLIICSCSG